MLYTKPTLNEYTFFPLWVNVALMVSDDAGCCCFNRCGPYSSYNFSHVFSITNRRERLLTWSLGFIVSFINIILTLLCSPFSYFPGINRSMHMLIEYICVYLRRRLHVPFTVSTISFFLHNYMYINLYLWVFTKITQEE